MLFTVTVKVRLAWEQRCAQCWLLPVLWICLERHTCPRSYPGRADTEEGASSDIMINPWLIPGKGSQEEGASSDGMINPSLIPGKDIHGGGGIFRRHDQSLAHTQAHVCVVCVGGGIFRWHKQFLSYPRRADCTHRDFSLHIPALSHGHHRITTLGTGVETL